MHFGILGPLEIRTADGTPVPPGGPQLRALLSLLALDAGQIIPAERLIDGMYGEEPPAGAANALQSQVSRLRRVLGDAGLVEFHPAGYRLAVDPSSVDVHEFVRLGTEGRRLLQAGDAAQAARLLNDARGLWRGQALAELPHAANQRARLEELRLATAEDWAEAQLALGGSPDLVAELQALVAGHPLRERVRGLLMQALYRTGRQAEALTAFDQARELLADELGVDPSPGLAAVHLAILRAEPAPAVRAAALPAQLTSFVGRETEVSRVHKLLATARLVTLLGPGGAGKTRLSIEAASALGEEVAFADLSVTTADEDVAHTLVIALGLREPGVLSAGENAVQGAEQRLVAALTGRSQLLILDNCEHVIDGAAQLAHRLLGACPGLRILATSREPLGITGEALCPLPELPTPAAVRLFADRAAAVQPGFTVDDHNRDCVLEICAALDGLPLAIELAAARLRTLPVEEVAARLGDRFTLLSRGSRTASPRHQTLHAVVEWSWELLSDDERTLARRLTVFAGGATAEAAGKVCGVPDAGELLVNLAEKSLIVAAGSRYTMLETMRAYCGERLAEAGETEALRLAHARHFLTLAETAEPHLRRAEQLEWLARLRADHSNLHAALRWCVDGDPHLGLRLAAALAWYWWLGGLRAESAPLAAGLLTAVGLRPPEGLEEEFVLCALNATPGGAHDPVERSYVEIARPLIAGFDGPTRWPFTPLMWAMAGGPPADEQQGLDEWSRRVGDDDWSRGLMAMGTGFMAVFAGDQAGAERLFTAGLASFRATGDRWGITNTLDQLAHLASARGDREGFLSMMDEAMDLIGQLNAHQELADLHSRRAEWLVAHGDLDGAEAGFEQAAALAARAGALTPAAAARLGLGQVHRLRGDLPRARTFLAEALAACPSGGYPAALLRCTLHIELGRTSEAAGDLPEARASYRRAVTVALAGPYSAVSVIRPAVPEAFASLAAREGDGTQAAFLLGAGQALHGGPALPDPDVTRATAAAQALIGEDFAPAHARGTTLTREEILELLKEL
ncbi:BTAD domain-containing putative transcriptional regulator [Longispora albida]|uniref:BTAD domain-containing putative transcriptional regulator n=1 Tax=Longispora albida TaxID=203523 RepID=UPI000381AD14|nr:BTAD domain-containing putative transcriptional regulator [Longispora albida]